MKIYRANNDLLIDVVVSDDSYRYKAIMGENAITATFLLPVFTEIPVGSYVDFKGERYTLLKPQNFTKNNTRDFAYTLILESSKSLLGRYKFLDSNTKKLKFSNTARPQEHLAMLVWNLNQRDSGWTVGDWIESVEKVVSFNHTSCDEALKMIAEAFNTEFEVVGKRISIKKVEYNKSDIDALPLSYGYGNGFKSGVKRQNFDNSKAIEVLYVQGGERNIDKSVYGNNELHMHPNALVTFNGTDYRVSADGLSLKKDEVDLITHIEDSLDLTNIYPRREGTVSSAVILPEGEMDPKKQYCDFFDAGVAVGEWGTNNPPVAIPANDVDYAQYRIDGEKATVIFQTGMLAGKEFDIVQTDTSITGYIHAEKRFKLVSQEIDGVTMPNSTFKPVAGDKYAVFGVKMPTEYTESAEAEMLDAAVKYFAENENPCFTFTGEIDEIWLSENYEAVSPKILLGGYVKFTDDQFQETSVLIRQVGIKDFINNTEKVQIELSNVTVGNNTLTSALGKIDQNEVVVDDAFKKTIDYANRRFRQLGESEKSFNYLKEAVEQGTIETFGGLTLANIMAVKNLEGIIRGGINGLDSVDVGAWFGGTFDDAINGLAKIIFNKDGSGQLAGGLIEWKYVESLLKLIIDTDNFKLDVDGNVEIVGTFKTGTSGQRVFIDPETQTLKMYDSLNRVVFSLSNQTSNGSFGYLIVNKYNGESEELVEQGGFSPAVVKTDEGAFNKVRIFSMENYLAYDPSTLHRVYWDSGSNKLVRANTSGL
jgi:predicted small secreted protein